MEWSLWQDVQAKLRRLANARTISGPAHRSVNAYSMRTAGQYHEDMNMSGMPARAAVVCTTGLAATGAMTATYLAGGRWAGFGAAIGRVTGPFAPTAYESLRAVTPNGDGCSTCMPPR